GHGHVARLVIEHAAQAIEAEEDIDPGRRRPDVEVGAEPRGDEARTRCDARTDLGHVARTDHPRGHHAVDGVRRGSGPDVCRPEDVRPRRHRAAWRRGTRVSTHTFASGKILCGFARPWGSKTARSATIARRSSGPKRSGICAIFSTPMPCSPV